jgi:hypothetical protein
MIAGIETPNTHFGKDDIPDYEENCGNNYSRKNSFPSFYIPHLVFKTIQKRYN